MHLLGRQFTRRRRDLLRFLLGPHRDGHKGQLSYRDERNSSKHTMAEPKNVKFLLLGKKLNHHKNIYVEISLCIYLFYVIFSLLFKGNHGNVVAEHKGMGMVVTNGTKCFSSLVQCTEGCQSESCGFLKVCCDAEWNLLIFGTG